MEAAMKELSYAAKDASAEAFYGSANANFSSQVDLFTQTDSRLRDLFHRTRAHYIKETMSDHLNPTFIASRSVPPK
jgi:hypothetical protein